MKKLFKLVLFFGLMAICANLAAADFMGLYQAGNYKKEAKESVTYLDCVAWSYTRPNYFNIQINFGRRDIRKNSKDGAMNTQFFMELTRAEYEKIFENRSQIINMPINDHIWNRRVSTSVSQTTRVINISFTNAIDDEITEVFKRGGLEIIMENGEIKSMKMRKERKRFLNIGGYKTVFVGEAKRMRRVKSGIGLLDEGEMGRVKTNDRIDKALANKTRAGFIEALKK